MTGDETSAFESEEMKISRREVSRSVMYSSSFVEARTMSEAFASGSGGMDMVLEMGAGVRGV